MFAVSPSMNRTGRLTFNPAATVIGTASCTVTLTEQVANGLSSTQSLGITVTASERLASARTSTLFGCLFQRWVCALLLLLLLLLLHTPLLMLLAGWPAHWLAAPAASSSAWACVSSKTPSR
jgi:hypothetical protein